MGKTLDPRPRRELTSREASAIISGLCGAMAISARPETIWEALDFFYAHREQMTSVWSTAWTQAVKANHVIPES